MLTQGKIDQFYQDVESLGLKKKVSDIQKATGFPKSNVSEWLSRKKTPSEKFIVAFYESFYKDSTLVTHGTAVNGLGWQGEKPRSDQAYLKLLEENDRFFKTEYHNLLISLNKLMEVGLRSEELIKLNLLHVGNVEAAQKGVDPEIVHEQINNQIAGKKEGQ